MKETATLSAVLTAVLTGEWFAEKLASNWFYIILILAVVVAWFVLLRDPKESDFEPDNGLSDLDDFEDLPDFK